MKERGEKDIPDIIDDLNVSLKPAEMTVESIAEKVGINKKILYEWVRSDTEFTTALGRLKDVQENDPFKTGTDEDIYVNSMMIALLLLETKDRHYESQNQ